MCALPRPMSVKGLSHQDRAFLEAVFSLLVTSRTNSFYYEARLALVGKVSFAIEFILAATASSSAVAGLSVLQDGGKGHNFWVYLCVASAFIAVIKPIYAPARKIQTFTRQHQSYLNNYFALQKLVNALKQAEHLSAEHRKRYETIYDRHVQLAGDDEAVPVSRAHVRAERRALQALPLEDFWRFWVQLCSADADSVGASVVVSVQSIKEESSQVTEFPAHQRGQGGLIAPRS